MQARHFKPVSHLTSTVPVTSQFKLSQACYLKKQQVVSLPSGQIAVAIDESKNYAFSVSTDVTQLKEHTLYLNHKSNQFFYSVITPDGKPVRDQPLFAPDAKLTLERLIECKDDVLMHTMNQSHTRRPTVEIWEFKENKQSVAAELKIDSKALSLHFCSDKLYVGHESTISVWDIKENKCIDVLNLSSLILEKRPNDHSKLAKKHKNHELIVTPEGYLFSFGQESLAIIELKSKKCVSFLTPSSFYDKKLELPAPYIVTSKSTDERSTFIPTTHSHALASIIWNKTTRKAVSAFLCQDFIGYPFDSTRGFSTDDFHIMANGKVIYHNSHSRQSFFDEDLDGSFEVTGLYESKLTWLYDRYYHHCEQSFPASFLCHMLLVHPDNKHLIYYDSNIAKIYDMQSKQFVCELRDIHMQSICKLLSDGRLLSLGRSASHLIDINSLIKTAEEKISASDMLAESSVSQVNHMYYH